MLKFLLASIRLIIVLVLTVIFLVLILLTYFLGFPLKIRHTLLKFWARSICIVLGIKTTICNYKALNGVMVLPNHRSWIDIPLIFSIVPATIIAKKEIKKWPLIGWGFKAIDAILVDRSKMGSLIATFKEIKRKVEKDRTVILFPEGTICEGPETGRFKNGAFKAAAEHQFKIVPVAFEFKDRRNVWADDDVMLITHFYKNMGRWKTIVNVEIGEPIRSENESWLLNTTKSWIDEKILNMRAEWDELSETQITH